jgi:tetratricopeptide (TPR) repeat protein
MIQGVERAWKLHRRPEPNPVWFERFLTPQFRAAFAAIDGCEAFAVHRAGDVPTARRTPAWRELLQSISDYPEYDLARKVGLLRLLGTLSLYRDLESLAGVDSPAAEGRMSRTEAEYRLIIERVRFILREPRMQRREVLAFLNIARRAPEGTTIRLEAAIFFLSRALEKNLPVSDIAAGESLAQETLATLKKALPAWDFTRWDSKYWRCISYKPYLLGRHDEARRQLERAEKSARECQERTPRGVPDFGLEDLYGVLTVKVLTEMKLGYPGRCRAPLHELIQIDPEGSWQRLELARVLIAAGDLDGAIEQLKENVRLGPPRRAAAGRLLAECYERSGRSQEADRWRREADRLGAAERFSGDAGGAA